MIEGDLLDAVYERQKRDHFDFCVKMYSRFHMDGNLPPFFRSS